MTSRHVAWRALAAAALAAPLPVGCAMPAPPHAQDLDPGSAPAAATPAPPAPAIKVQALDAAAWDAPAAGEHSAWSLQSGPGAPVRLAAARNETLGFFLRIESTAGSHGRVELRCSFAGHGMFKVDVFRCLFTAVDRPPGWQIKSIPSERRRLQVPDVLIPLGTAGNPASFDLGPGNPLVLWIDLGVLSSAAPGLHRLALRFYSGEQELAVVPIEATVRSYALPDDPGVALLGPLDLQNLLGHHLRFEGQPHHPENILEGDPLFDQATRLVHETVRLLQQHRVCPLLQGLHPIRKYASEDTPGARGDQAAGAELVVDWTDYDRLVERLLAGELYPGQPPVQFWPIPFDERFPPAPPYDALDSPTYARELRQYLTLCEDHFANRGWLERAFIMLPRAALGRLPSQERVRLFAEIARAATNRLPLVALTPPQDLRAYGWEDYPFVDLLGLANVWCLPAQFFDPAVFERPELRGQQRWLELDRPPFSGSVDIAARSTDVRVIPWQGQRLAAQAVLLPEVNNWSQDFGETDLSAHLRQGRTPLIIPGRHFDLDVPVPTVRLKMLRRGMQDLAVLALCREQNQEAAGLVARSLCRRAGAEVYGAHFADGQFDAWTEDPAVWNQAATLMEVLLEQLATSEDLQPASPLDTLGWLSFAAASPHLVLRGAGAALRRRSGLAAAGQPEAEIELMLQILNQTGESTSCNLQFGQLPLGWQPAEPDGLTLALDADDQARASLTALASTIPSGPAGRLEIPVRLSCGEHELAVRVPVAHVTAQRLKRRPQIDGDLSDWPVGVGNSAAGLVAISAAQQEGSPALSPDQEVLALAAWDRDHLYFALHAFRSGPAGGAAPTSNFLVHDDRVPVGEDLVEILIDPTNGRSANPGDLYHIAIKPTAAVCTERGVRSQPQVGNAEPWPADIEVATRALEDRWVAEVKIPLKDFGPLADVGQTWGLDFTRFCPLTNIYSTWSGTRWNTYHPASLGNMTFGE